MADPVILQIEPSILGAIDELARKAKPRLLIIYHASIVLRPGLRPQASSPEELLKEVLSGYNGEVVVARDLDVY